MTTHEITWKYILNQLVKHQNLTDTEVAWAMDQIMTGQTEQPILASFLTALHSKGETPEELGALAAGMIAKAETVDIDPNAVDIVGTGGDQQNTVNISTMAALVIAGTGANATSEAIVMTKLLRDSGVAGCLSVVPYYNKPTQEGMFQHFKAIAECTDLPQLLYNVPGRTGSDMKPETVARLSQIENIVGIKEATGDLTRITAIKELAGKDFIVLSGDDATGLEAMKLGAEGVISVTNNLAAKDMAAMCRYALAGDFAKAEEINARLMPLHQDLFIESNPIPVKWAAYRLGLIKTPHLRLPLTVLSESAQVKVEEALKIAGLI